MEYRTIGANLRKIRLQKNMRQEDLAEKTSLSPNYIGAVERGERIPSLETFITLLNIYVPAFLCLILCNRQI